MYMPGQLIWVCELLIFIHIFIIGIITIMKLILVIIITFVICSIVFVIHSTDIVIIINPTIKLEFDDAEKKENKINFYEYFVI